MSLRIGNTSMDMEKSETVASDDGKADVRKGEQHLQELEVDISTVLHEEGQFDFESDQSPFPEGMFETSTSYANEYSPLTVATVRAVIPSVDDPETPINTFRMWVLGIVFTILGSGVNQFFSLRYPSVRIVSLVAELVAYPCGVFLANILPTSHLNLGILGIWCINPDHHFNIKEHAIITIMSNVSFGYGSADSTAIIQSYGKFYGFHLYPGFSILVVLCCQLLGFGVAGLASPWLIEPAGIIWPGVLSNCALLSSLHSRANAVANGWKISRLCFFMYVTAGAFVWYFFPGLIFVGLSYFTWVCWIVPSNLVANHLFGMVTGLGLSPITFDWSQVAYNTNPLLSPSWAALNVFAGFALFFWIVVPGIYYSNIWFTAYLPLMTADVYDNTGSVYNVTRIMNADGSFNAQEYANYSPPFLGASFAFVYGLSFASITAVLVHVYLFHGTDICDVFRGRGKLDIHARLMRGYKRTPWYWYAAITVLVLVLAIVMVEVYKVKLPVYGVFLAFTIPAVYMIPCGIIEGITNVNANQINVLAEFVGGYMFHGTPLANMVFKILSQDVVGQGLYFAQDMKLGHYLKIAPRRLFFVQGFATILGALTQVGVTTWMLGNVKNVCSHNQSDGFSCPVGRTVFSSSVVWGAIGPNRLYSAGKIYSSLLHFFWIGALMPILTWCIWKRTKKDFWRKVNWPLIFVGTYNVPPATGINYSSWALVNFIFNHIIYRKFFAWWTKYNYVLAAALDTGLAISGLIIFLCISYPGGKFPDWWGNTVHLNTADGNGLPWKALPESGHFGPPSGTWS